MQVPELHAVVERLQGCIQDLESQQSDQQRHIQSLQDQKGSLEGQVTDLTGQNEAFKGQAAKVNTTGLDSSGIPCAPGLLPFEAAETVLICLLSCVIRV